MPDESKPSALLNVRAAFAEMAWAILPEKLEAIAELLTLRAQGGVVPPDVKAAVMAAARRSPLSSVGGGTVAVIPMDGTIAPRANLVTEASGGTSAEQFVAQVEAAVANPQVTAIVLDVNSPGGSVQGVTEAAARLRAARGTKPIIAVANHLMASAAYWLAAQADEVIASPSAEVGSIGVFATIDDSTAAAEQAGVKRILVKAGANKAQGIPGVPVTDDAIASLQGRVDEYYAQFVADVAAGRGTTAAAIEARYGQGAVLTASQALAAGMVDRVDSLATVLAELTGAPVASPMRAMRPAAVAASAISASATTADMTDMPAEPDDPAMCPTCGKPMNDDGECDECAHATTTTPTEPKTADARGAAPVAPQPRIHVTGPRGQESNVSETNTAARNGPDTNDREAEVREIAALAEQHAMQDRLPSWLSAGASLSEVRADAMGVLRERLAKGPVTKPRVELSEKEEREYSYTRAMLAAVDGVDCFEQDIHQELAKKLPQGYKPQGGFFLPTTIRAAGLDTATSTKGAELKFTQYGGFVDYLRAQARVLQAGATFLSGLDGPVTLVKQNGAGTFAWVGENPGSDTSESNLLLTTVSLAAKTGMSTTSFSRQLLRQSVESVEGIVRNDLAAIHALGVDAAALYGTGSSNQPTGVFATSGINVYVGSADSGAGGAPTYGDMVGQQVKVKQANADIGALAYITTPGIEGTLMTTQEFPTSANGVAVWRDGKVANINAFSTTQVQSNLTKSTGSNLHAIYCGVWSQLLIGEWGAMEIIVDPLRLKKQGMIEVTSFQMIDIAVRQPAAFSVNKAAISTY